VLVDRLVIKSDVDRRLTDSVDLALNLADDIVIINTYDGGDQLSRAGWPAPTAASACRR